MSTLLSRGELRDLTPSHWTDDVDCWRCFCCEVNFTDDKMVLDHPQKTGEVICKECLPDWEKDNQGDV